VRRVGFESVGIEELAGDSALDPGTATIWLATDEAPVKRIDLR
jgi:hypothetical protein